MFAFELVKKGNKVRTKSGKEVTGLVLFNAEEPTLVGIVDGLLGRWTLDKGYSMDSIVPYTMDLELIPVGQVNDMDVYVGTELFYNDGIHPEIAVTVEGPSTLPFCIAVKGTGGIVYSPRKNLSLTSKVPAKVMKYKWVIQLKGSSNFEISNNYYASEEEFRQANNLYEPVMFIGKSGKLL